MSSIVLFIKIIGVTGSTLSDADTGLVNGNLQWASVNYIDGYKSGIIDESSIDGVAVACNISQGGTLGGFDGNVTIAAVSDELMLKVISGQYIMIGREITIDVGMSVDPYAAIRRYTGTIGTWEASDEITIDITCMPNTAFNKKVIPSVTITKELALNVADSNAIGKNVTTTYGNICDFPLTAIPSSAVSYAFSIDSTESTIIHNEINYALPNGKQVTTNSGKYKGLTDLQILAIYQSYSDQYIWICLSINGAHPLFNDSQESQIQLLKKSFIGLNLKCIRGVGNSSIVKILDIEWNTHNSESGISIENFWMQINTIDKSSFKEAGGFISTGNPLNSDKTANYPLYLYTPRFPLSSSSSPSSYFKATYDKYVSKTLFNSNMSRDISYLNLCSSDSIFSISSTADLSSCKLVGMDNNNEYKSTYDIPVNSIDILYSNSLIKLIKINVKNFIKDDSSSLGLAKIVPSNTYFHDGSQTGISLNTSGWTNEIDRTVVQNDYIPLWKLISESQWTNSSLIVSDTHVDNKVFAANCIIIPMADLLDNNDITLNDFTSSILPKFKYEYDPSSNIFPARSIELWIDINVIGESNISYGCVTSKLGGYFDIGSIAFIEVNPDLNSVIYSANYHAENESDDLQGFDEYSPVHFNRLMSELDVTEIIKGVGIERINSFLVSIRLLMPSGWETQATFKKTIGPCRIGFTKQIAKDKLFLRSTRVNELVTDVDSPAMLALSIARENGISVTASSLASFVDTQGYQRGMYYTYPSEYDGQYQPDDNTSVLDALSEIAKQSMMAIYTERDGSIRAKWFADMDATSPVVHTFTDVIKKSMKISKNQNGYRYTDFVFTIMKNNYQKKEMLYINTDVNTNSFPDAGVSLRSGPIYNVASSWIIIRSDNLFWDDSFGSHQIMGFYFRRSALLTNPMLVFTRGTKWVLTDIYNNEMIAELTVIAIDAFCPLGYLGARIGFTMEGRADTFSPSSFQLYGPNPQWNNFVSGTFISDYTIARNIWEHANDARRMIGSERAMPSATTTLIDPIWGSDDRALMQWVAYSTIFCTREKTVISFAVEMSLETLALWVMDYVEFGWGVYSNAHTKGWIVEIDDDYKKGVINFKILTSISDSDVLILDERTNQYSMIADSTTSDFTNTYDQGALA